DCRYLGFVLQERTKAENRLESEAVCVIVRHQFYDAFSLGSFWFVPERHTLARHASNLVGRSPRVALSHADIAVGRRMPDVLEVGPGVGSLADGAGSAVHAPDFLRDTGIIGDDPPLPAKLCRGVGVARDLANNHWPG